MTKRQAIKKFEAACAELNAIMFARPEMQLYVAGSGSFHLMDGESHERNGAPRRHAIVASVSVSKFGGGDW